VERGADAMTVTSGIFLVEMGAGPSFDLAIPCGGAISTTRPRHPAARRGDYGPEPRDCRSRLPGRPIRSPAPIL